MFWFWFWFWFGVFLPVVFACRKKKRGRASFLPCLFSNHLLKVFFLWYKRNTLRDTKKKGGKHFVFFSCLWPAPDAQQTPTCHSKCPGLSAVASVPMSDGTLNGDQLALYQNVFLQFFWFPLSQRCSPFFVFLWLL